MLQQFHFHTPGGERIAVEEFTMVAHLLHKSWSGQLLAVAVHFRIGAESPLLDTLMPIIPAKADGDHALTGVVMHASALLPPQRGYYRYAGSLTAAPCTEGVDWVVLKQPLELSGSIGTLPKTVCRQYSCAAALASACCAGKPVSYSRI